MELPESGGGMKITDMNIDCLESCFNYLNVEELLNVADSNTQLKHAARSVFNRVYRQKKMHVIRRSRRSREIWDNKNLIFYELKVCLQLLRCFGDLISTVRLSFHSYDEKVSCNIAEKEKHPSLQFEFDNRIRLHQSRKYDYLYVNYINEYCSESLTSIDFWGVPYGDLSKLTKCFGNVEKLQIVAAFPIGKKLCELFPKVRQMKLWYWEHCSDGLLHHKIASHFPYLEHLTIQGGHPCEKEHKNFASALRLNPQLKSLKGTVWMDVIFGTDFHFNASEYFQNLEELDLQLIYESDITKSIGKNIHLTNLKELCMSISNFLDTPYTIPFTSDKLEYLKLEGCYITPAHFYSIIDQFPTLKKLTFGENAISNYLTDFGRYANIIARTRIEIDFSIISKKLPLLEEIHLKQKDRVPTIDAVVLAINSFRSLRLFESHVHRHFEIGRLTRLLNGWSVTSGYDGRFPNLILERLA